MSGRGLGTTLASFGPADVGPSRLISDLRSVVACVIGINYAPESTGIAPYTSDFCQTLVGDGIAVTVITGFPHYPQWRVHEGYRRRLLLRENAAGVDVHRIPHVVPRRHHVVSRSMYELSFACSGLAATSRLTPDVVIAVTPSPGSLPPAAALARRCNVPLGILVQDMVGRAAVQSGLSGGRLVAKVAEQLEGRWLRRADRVAVISPAFVSHLHSIGVPADHITELRNFSHVRPTVLSQQQARREIGWPSDRYVVVHTGNMGFKQDLSNMVEAARIAKSRHPELLFVLVGDGSTRQALERLAGQLDNIIFCPPLPADVYPNALAAADCLVVNERASVTDMSLPSKLTSYFIAGRPIIAAVPAHGATAQELRRAGAAILVGAGNPLALVEGLLALRHEPETAKRLGEEGMKYAATHLTAPAARERSLRFFYDVLSARAAEA